MARDEMADHVQMFELFAQVKEVAIGEDNPEGVAFVDDLISLWTKMLLDDAVRDDTITANVRSMQDASIQQISAMQEGLSKMHAFAVQRKTLVQTCSEAMLDVIRQEREVQALKSDLNNKKEDMLRKAKMILKREQDRAGNTILDCQKSMVRLQEDMNNKIRETEKKLASSEKAKADTLAQLATKKAECDEHLEKISKLMRELKGKTAELNGCQTELQKTSEALQEEASQKEKQSKRADDAKVQIDDLNSKLKTLGTESSTLQDDLKKKLSELESLRAQLLKEQGRSGDLEKELSKSSNELKAQVAVLKSCQTELQKTSEALQQEVTESEKRSKRAADAQVQIDDLTSKLKTLGTESSKLQDDLQTKMTGEFESLRAQLLREQGKSKDLEDELNKSSKLVRDAEGAVRCLAVEICALEKEFSISNQATLHFAKDRLVKERKAAVEQVQILQEQKGSLQNEMDSEVELIKIENKKLTRSVNKMAQTHEDHRNRIVNKIANRLLLRYLWMSLSTWQSIALNALRLRRKAALVVQKMLNGHSLKSFACWRDFQKAQAILWTKLERVLKRFTHKSLSAAWEKWLSEHTEAKRLKALTKKVLGRWRGDVLGKALNEWIKKGKENKRLKAAAGKIVLRWTIQVSFF
jgi:chromosome segregation ATPase